MADRFELTKDNLEYEKELIRIILSPEYRYDPLKFIMFAFPWGKENTPLEGIKSPRKWQIDYIKELVDYYEDNEKKGLTDNIFKKATKSGRGSGKSALIGMIQCFLFSTRPGMSIINTANNESQLLTKTMPEISKWFRMAINSHWFDYNAMSIKPARWYSELLSKDPAQGGFLIEPSKYLISAQLWSAENPNAFAGEHNIRGEAYFFDEGDGIPDPIWQVTEGVFTEKIIDKYWMVFSNPRSNTGPFFECFNKLRDEWRPLTIDTRDVPEVSPRVYESIINKYGVDSNEAKIEIYGEFPESTEDQFIDVAAIREAMSREIVKDDHAPLIMGVDLARSEKGDRSVICFRKGRDARSIPWQVYKGLKGDAMVTKICEAIDRYNPDAVMVDGGGLGGPIIDVVRSLGYYIIEVQAGAKAIDSTTFPHKRPEMWTDMKNWIDIGCLPDNPDLLDDLKGPKVDHNRITGQMILESGKDMKKRGLASPDMASALSQTFAYKVASKNIASYQRKELVYPSLGIAS